MTAGLAPVAQVSVTAASHARAEHATNAAHARELAGGFTVAEVSGLVPDFTRRCADCAHISRRKTCGEPVAAGLLPPGAAFGLVWPGPVQAAACPAFTLASTARG